MRLTEALNCGIDFTRADKSSADPEVVSVTQDSREVGKGYIFVAVSGVNLNGEDFIPDAIKKGAAAIICGSDFNPKEMPVPFFQCDNTRLAVTLIAAKFFPRQPKFIAAVTGTNGKTSTVNFCRQIWALLGKKSASMGTIGTTDWQDRDYGKSGSMTTPDPITLHKTLQQLKEAGVEYLAMEASSHGLHQYRLDGIRIAAAGFTNLSRDHLDYHKDMEDYLNAKLRLFSDLLKKGTAIINSDIPEFAKIEEACRKNGNKVVSFGSKGDIKLKKITPTEHGQDIEFEIEGKSFRKSLTLVGDFQISNLMCSIGMVMSSGIPAENIVAVLDKVNNVNGRMERAATLDNGAQVFVDYAHTPDALEKALKTLRPHTKGKLLVVFGCGGNRDKGKRPQMGKIACDMADMVVVTDDNPRNEDPATIRKEILAACGKDVVEIGDRAKAIDFAVSKMAKSDMLLVAGKGHEKTQIIRDKIFDFDDVQVVKDAVSGLGKKKEAAS